MAHRGELYLETRKGREIMGNMVLKKKKKRITGTRREGDVM